MVSQTAGRNSAAETGWRRSAVEHALRCRHGRDPRAGFVEHLPRLLAVRVPCRGEQQRLQHLHVVLDAVIELVEQERCCVSACLRSLISTSMLIAPMILPVGVAQRRRIWDEGNARAVRPLGDRLDAADRRGLP